MITRMITQMSGVLQGPNGDQVMIGVNVLLPLPPDVTLAEFLGTVKVVAGSPVPNFTNVYGGPVDEPNAIGPSVFAPAAPVSGSTEQGNVVTPPATTRRRRTAAEMEAAKATKNPTNGSTEASVTSNGQATSTEGVSRRRRAAPPPSNDPMPINDAEMSKAASNAAEELVKLGDDGPGLVKAVLADYGVASVGDIPQEKREAFIQELKKEVDLAKADTATS